jgi:hypothetical protein
MADEFVKINLRFTEEELKRILPVPLPTSYLKYQDKPYYTEQQMREYAIENILPRAVAHASAQAAQAPEAATPAPATPQPAPTQAGGPRAARGCYRPCPTRRSFGARATVFGVRSMVMPIRRSR